MGLFDFFKKKSTDSATTSFDATSIVEQLRELGYFKYTAPADVAEISADLENALKEHYFGSSIFFMESPFNSKDYRHYHFDGEDLFEEGGFLWQLNAMKTLFQKMDFQLDISDHIEEYSEAHGVNHRITLNGKAYIIFQNFNGYGWGEAAQRFAEIINDQLALQNKNECLYLMNGGNDGNAVYLTDEQFALINPLLKSIDKPMKVEDWCRYHQVNPLAYKGNS